MQASELLQLQQQQQCLVAVPVVHLTALPAEAALLSAALPRLLVLVVLLVQAVAQAAAAGCDPSQQLLQKANQWV